MSRIQEAHESQGYPYWLVDMAWHTPPANQGQSVEVSYASDHCGRYYERTVDHSDGSYRYRATPFGSLEDHRSWQPWNDVPDIAEFDWCDIRQVPHNT